MNIAVFSDNFYPEISGISDSLVMTAKALAGRGHRVGFWAPRYSRANYRRLDLAAEEPVIAPGVEIHRLPAVAFRTGTGQGRAAIPAGFMRSVRTFAPDVVHVHLPYGCGAAGAYAARRLGVPLVGTNHTPIAEFVSGRIMQHLMISHHTRFFQRCDHVTSPCTAIMDMMIDKGFSRSWEVVPNPVDLDLFEGEFDKAALKRSYGLGEFSVLYSGRLAPEKRIELIIDAFAAARRRVPHLTLAIVGDGSSRARLESHVRERGLDGPVKFFGYVAPAAFAEIYHASDLFAMMSRAETQSISVMNAMACGLPVVCARAWGLAEYVEGRGVLVPPGDWAAMSDELVLLANNSERCRTLGERGRTFVSTLHANAVAARWESLYARRLSAVPMEVRV
jgi:1,2-diacylglycerol 3-alpha-glucosyltransferase